MTVSVNNIHSGSQDNISGSAGISSSQAGTISTSADGQTVVLIFAVARTDTVTNHTRITGVTASGLTFEEVFDYQAEYNVGGSFPITNWHLQMFVAPAPTQITGLSWTTTMSQTFSNTTKCIGFAVAGTGNYAEPFDGELPPATAVDYYNSDTDSALDQPTVNITTGDANTLLLSIFNDNVQDGDAVSSAFTAGTGKTGIANVQVTRQYAVGNLFAQYQTVTSAQSAVAQEPAASTRKFWQAVTIAFTETGVSPTSNGRISQVGVEVLQTTDGNARVSQEAAEVLHTADGNARVSQVAVEVLRSVAVYVPGASRPVLIVVT